MIHDPRLVDQIAGLPTSTFAGEVFRATRRQLEPVTPSTSGGRWAPVDGPAVLYTSFRREGALAEIAFHWGRLNPRPTAPVRLHTLWVTSERTLRLVRADLDALGVEVALYADPNYTRTQQIGAVVAFLGLDGLIVPSARWDCDNLVLFTDNLSGTADLEQTSAEDVDWQAWAQAAGLID